MYNEKMTKTGLNGALNTRWLAMLAKGEVERLGRSASRMTNLTDKTMERKYSFLSTTLYLILCV